jgi:phage terminase small subunit
MKNARPIVETRQKEAEAIRAREMEAEIAESAKRLNITRERILEEYSKIAFFDIRKIFTVDGGLMEVREIDDESAGAIAGIESVDEKTRTGEVLGTLQKIKIANKKEALDSICKIMGYFAPVKMANTDPNGNPVTPPPLNITVAHIEVPIAEKEE